METRLRSNAGRADRAGFSLAEALVAMAILAAAASTALIVAAGGADRDSEATARLRATLAADALLNRVGIDIPLKTQSISGKLRDGAAWRIDVRPFEEVEAPPSGEDALLRLEVVVTPKGFRARSVRLVTLRALADPT